EDQFARSAEELLLHMEHEYRDYVRLMLAWRLTQRDRKDEARRLLKNRSLEIPPDDSPQARAERLAEGDLNPWRDRFIRYYLDPGEENRRAVLDPVGSPAAFEADPIHASGQSYTSFRCEALFYDALLQSITGDAATRRERY